MLLLLPRPIVLLDLGADCRGVGAIVMGRVVACNLGDVVDDFYVVVDGLVVLWARLLPVALVEYLELRVCFPWVALRIL